MADDDGKRKGRWWCSCGWCAVMEEEGSEERKEKIEKEMKGK